MSNGLYTHPPFRVLFFKLVARDEAYNLSVDCYSFAILFWQICSLQTPYAGFNQETHALQVVQRGHRPKPDKSWPRSWTQLMTAAWSAIPVSRPLASDLSAQVIEIVAEMAEADGVVPSRASEIKAKKKRKKISLENRVLDMDSRTTSMSTTTTAAVTTIQTQGADIV